MSEYGDDWKSELVNSGLEVEARNKVLKTFRKNVDTKPHMQNIENYVWTNTRFDLLGAVILVGFLYFVDIFLMIAVALLLTVLMVRRWKKMQREYNYQQYKLEKEEKKKIAEEEMLV